VAVLDTGVDRLHPALAGHLAAGYDFVDGDADPSEQRMPGMEQAYGHGTHVAGLVALAAPEATILPLRTLTADGVGTVWTQVQALRYAAEQGADVINLSFSMGVRSETLADVLAGDHLCRSHSARLPGLGEAGDGRGRRRGEQRGECAGVPGGRANSWPARGRRKHRGGWTGGFLQLRLVGAGRRARRACAEHGAGRRIRQLERHVDGRAADRWRARAGVVVLAGIHAGPALTQVTTSSETMAGPVRHRVDAVAALKIR
jgi:hypothetical protein